MKPLIEHIPTHLWNSSNAIDLMSKAPNFTSQAVVCSMDIVNMYNNIPIEEAIETAMNLIDEHQPLTCNLRTEDIGTLLRFMLTNNIFQFHNEFFKQKSGLSMGSRISPILSNLVLDRLERRVLRKGLTQDPLFYIRYVDDTLAVFVNEQSADMSLTTLNSSHLSLSFTMEKTDPCGWIPFLDMKIKIEDGRLTHKFYQKDTKKDIIIHESSAIPRNVKMNTISSELNRANVLCSKQEDKLTATKFITEKFLGCGYNKKTIATAKQKRKNKINNSFPLYVNIPFVSDNFNWRMKHALQLIHPNIRIYTKENTNLRSFLTKRPTKDTECNKRRCIINNRNICERRFVVYSVICDICQQEYIGSTIRQLHDRIQEHMRSSPSTAISEHIQTCGSQKQLHVTVICQQRNEASLRVAESLWIYRKKPALNRRDECEQAASFISHYVDAAP